MFNFIQIQYFLKRLVFLIIIWPNRLAKKIYVLNNKFRLTDLLRNGGPEIQMGSCTFRVRCNFRRSCTADNKELCGNVDPCILPNIGKSFRDYTSLHWHIFCHTLDLGLLYLIT
jgi:hypothetical protein